MGNVTAPAHKNTSLPAGKVKYARPSSVPQVSMKFTKQFQRYESEITQFIAELKKKNPALEEEQRAGRALLWDKTPRDLDAQDRTTESSVSQQSYVYQNKL